MLRILGRDTTSDGRYWLRLGADEFDDLTDLIWRLTDELVLETGFNDFQLGEGGEVTFNNSPLETPAVWQTVDLQINKLNSYLAAS